MATAMALILGEFRYVTGVVNRLCGPFRDFSQRDLGVAAKRTIHRIRCPGKDIVGRCFAVHRHVLDETLDPGLQCCRFLRVVQEKGRWSGD